MRERVDGRKFHVYNNGKKGIEGGFMVAPHLFACCLARHVGNLASVFDAKYRCAESDFKLNYQYWTLASPLRRIGGGLSLLLYSYSQHCTASCSCLRLASPKQSELIVRIPSQ
jgi:hypothetical protein